MALAIFLVHEGVRQKRDARLPSQSGYEELSACLSDFCIRAQRLSID